MSKEPSRRSPGSRGTSFVRVLAAALVTLGMVASAASAASWTPAGVEFVNALTNQSSLRSVSDGQGGFIAAWLDARNAPAEIFCQRVDSTGVAQWTANGVLVCSTLTGISNLTAAADGQNGILLSWVADGAAAERIVYMQRLDPAGAALWTANGLRADVTTVAPIQGSPAICSDAAGGAIVAWADTRGSKDSVYVKRVLSAGTRAWNATGVLVEIDADHQRAPRLVEDGAGGAFVSWEVIAGTTKTHFQHFDATGAPSYGSSYVPVTARSQSALMARQAGSDSLVIAWAASSPNEIFGAKLDPAGVLVPGGSVGQLLASPAAGSLPVGLLSQVSGGALVVYANGSVIAAQTMDARGLAGATPVTLASGQTLGASSNVNVVSDGSDGLFCVWSSSSRGFAQHLTSAAAKDWLAPVALVTGSTPAQTFPVAVGGTDLIVSWIDDRNATTGDDLFAQRVSFSGVTGTYYRILTAIGAGSGASTLTPSAGRAWVREGDLLLVRGTGATGYYVDRLVVGATNLLAVPNYTFHNVTGDSMLTAFFTNTPITTQVVAVAKAYRAFSMPSTFTTSDVPASVFANLMPYDITRWRLGHWEADDSTYLEPSGALAHIVPGAGYWFIGLKDTTLSFAGGPLPQAEFALPMLGGAISKHGWTQFGSPFRFPLAVSQLRLSLGPDVPISTTPNNFTDQQVFEWNPATSLYEVVSVLLPGHAYWLWRQSTAALNLRFPFDWNPVAVGALPQALPSGADWAVGVAARAGTHAASLTFGAATVAAGRWNGLSSHSLPAVSVGGLSLVARVTDWGEDNGEYQSVYRPDDQDLGWDFDASAATGLTETALSFSLTNVPPGRRVVLSEPAMGWSREVGADDVVSLVLTANPRQLRLEVLAGVRDSPRPAAVTALRAVGPNPFREATTLSFALAHDGPLRWDVFDLAGRRVNSAVQTLAAGEHTLTWDGRDGTGRRVTPGLYLLRWQAGGVSGSARLVRAQ